MFGRDDGQLPPTLHFYEGATDDTVLPPAEYAALFRVADCFVLPTHGEGWCRPCMEAMAAGLPAIVTGWSGHTDFMLPASWA